MATDYISILSCVTIRWNPTVISRQLHLNILIILQKMFMFIDTLFVTQWYIIIICKEILPENQIPSNSSNSTLETVFYGITRGTRILKEMSHLFSCFLPSVLLFFHSFYQKQNVIFGSFCNFYTQHRIQLSSMLCIYNGHLRHQ